MSAVTKIFVVLLVLLATFQSAAMIVFVNRSEDSKAIADKAVAARDAANRLVSDREASNSALRSQLAAVGLEKDAQAAAARDTDTKKDQANAALQTENQSLKSAKTQSDTTAAATADALATAQKTIDTLQTQLADSRKTIDEQLAINAKQAVDANVAGDTIDGLTHEVKRLQLQNADLVRQNKAQADAMQHQTNPDGSAAVSFNPATLPKVIGVIRSEGKIGQQMYATISVGSKDSIAKNMDLWVVQNGTFIGKLRVLSVDNDQAFGQLDGPKIEQIQPGVTNVYTRLD